MPERSGFYTSSNGDRKYKPDRFARRFRDFFTDGIIVDGGGILSTELEVSAVGGVMQTSIAVGVANVQGYDYEIFNSPVILTHPNADGVNPRIDRVVVQISRETGRTGIVKVLEGTPAGSPVAPALTRDATDFYELSLAQVLIGAGVTEITGGNITDERSDDVLCGISNANVGITIPTGNSASVITVDDANFDILVGTQQQQLDDNIDNLLAGNFIPPTGVTAVNNIDITVPDQTYVDGQEIKFYLASDFAPGGNITLTVKNDTPATIIGPYEIEDVENVALTELSKGYVTVYYQLSAMAFRFAPKGGASVKSIQHVTVGFTAGVGTLDIDISPVDTSKSIIHITHQDGEDGGGTGSNMATVEFLDSDTIRIKRDRTSGTVNLYCQVMEFENVKSKQVGQENGGSEDTRTVAISTIDPLKSFIFVSFRCTGGFSAFRTGEYRGRILNSTQIEIKSGDLTTTWSLRWQVIEFN